ncbi:MAG: 1-deoxy-D-xylulose-5-phosphate reductoisomerase [Firmicutes bacterium]|nr:1-deoxy-D-xylulose-5-phosphate reductoisomerase [Bacillota bacterium]
MRSIAVFGSTGSVGTQTLDVVRANADRFSVFALITYCGIEKLIAQAKEFKPKYVAIICSKQKANAETGGLSVESRLPKGTKLLVGDSAVEYLAAHKEAEILMVAMLGAVNSLTCILAGIRASDSMVRDSTAGVGSAGNVSSGFGKIIAVASKEAYVCGGDLINEALSKSKTAKIIPVDSEHSAVYQLLKGQSTNGQFYSGQFYSGQSHNGQGVKINGVKKITLTASGGSMYGKPLAQLENACVESVLKHPKWNMGAKITVDSATLVNKGLEIIEASYIFGVSEMDVVKHKKIDFVIHRQSLVHGIVDFVDGTTFFNISAPDMRIPINYALGYPSRLSKSAIGANIPNVSLEQLNSMTFETNDDNLLKGVALCLRALEYGLTAHLNFANDILVERFLKKQISFLDIYKGLENVLEHFAKKPKIKADSLDKIVSINSIITEYL